MYGKIFLLIILCKKVLTDDEEINEKYIDLLPEEEKQEFLNRIARRILEGINSHNTPNESHTDITDDQLDVHDAFVKEILKEESDNLKDNMRQTDNQEVDGNLQVQNKNAESNDNTNEPDVFNARNIEEIIKSQQRQSDNARADNIDRVQPDNDERIKNIDDKAEFNNGEMEEDVTLPEGIRQKRNDSTSNIEAAVTTEISYEVIPVKTVYDQDKGNVEIINEPLIMSVNKNINLNVEQEGHTHGYKEIPVSELGNSSNLILITNDLVRDSPNNTDKIDDPENLREKEITVSSLGNASNLEVSSNDLLTKSNKINNSANFRKSFHRKLTSTKLEYLLPSDVVQSSHDYDINDYTTLLSTKISAETTVRTENGNTHKIYKNEERQKSTNNVSPTELNDLSISVYNLKTSDSESRLSEVINITNSNEYKDEQSEKSVLKTAVSNDSLSPIDLRPLEKSSNTTKFSEFYNSSPKSSSSIFEHPEGVVKYTTVINDSALKNHISEVSIVKNSSEKQDNKKILRTRLDEYDYFQKAEDSKKVKVYDVYEVGADQPHFISTGDEKQNEHPLNVPVYNYAPENAYFKPHNKFGPNLKDMKKQDIPGNSRDEYSFKILPNTRNRFSGYSYNKKRSSYDKITTKQTYDTKSKDNKKAKSMTNDFMKTLKEKLINQNIHYNPRDYADLDYYYGRILRRDEKRSNIYNDNQIQREIENGGENIYKKFIPESNDADPTSGIHKSDKIKDHVRAIRKILFLKNHFGYVPKKNENVVRKANLYSEISDKPKKDSISIDYYFGRADSDEKSVDMTKLLHRLKNKYINKGTNLDFSPLTANPLEFEDISKNLPNIEKYRSSHSQDISYVPFKKLFESLLVVLKDSIQVENENLVKYDWLKSTVNIQAAIRKLLDLIEQLKYGEYIHPKDLELIKYTIYIFKSSKTILDEESKNTDLYKLKSTELQRASKKNTVQKMPKTKRLTKIKEPIKLWKNFATFLRSDEMETEGTQYKILDDFEDFLRELLLNLHDLHDTIKQISIITEYKKQNWFKDLKDLYLGKGNEKNLAQVILHLSLSKLLDSIEDSSMHGAEDNFRSFIKKNPGDVKKCKEECLLVLKILEEIKIMNH